MCVLGQGFVSLGSVLAVGWKVSVVRFLVMGHRSCADLIGTEKGNSIAGDSVPWTFMQGLFPSGGLIRIVSKVPCHSDSPPFQGFPEGNWEQKEAW